ncbi:hypothetical protein [Hyalangium minutum]|uniref:Uncharacterized protein n=1 Tax=Hyalangium minutum TaxID=394096 RepID=A0A085WU33_9BACT|nr:hypothetical protein [Hyalangium minutum]KFE71196.1 hypothetical protein DB31_3326 [Hyalangium minutum]
MPEVDLPIARDARSLIPPTLQRTMRRSLSRGPEAGTPAKPLFGVLPFKRFVPQDIHSLLDYANGLTVLGVAMGAAKPACTAGLALGMADLGVSLLTDYRLSLRKIIPIEVHEFIDYAWGLAAIASPFVFGYARRSPLSAIVHVAVGVSTIIGSLFTDYRAQVGVKWSKRRLSEALPLSGAAVGA